MNRRNGEPTEADRGGSDFELREPEVNVAKFEDDGIIPNSGLPVLVYKSAIDIREGTEQSALERDLGELVAKNQWRLEWAWQVYKYIHYHSTAHEALIVFSGQAVVQMGGPRVGKNFSLSKGDMIIIPAGVAHECLEKSDDFTVFGLYPQGQNWDMNYGTAEERESAMENIESLSLPQKDPIYGDGPLIKNWKKG